MTDSSSGTPTATVDTAEVPTTGVVVAVLAFAGIVVAVMHTLVVPLIPQFPTLLNAPAADTAWVITSTLLAAAVAVPTMGRLGDMFGKRRMMLVSLALLIAGSVVGALSTSVVPLIVGRALQGLAAGVIPLGISVMRDVIPARKLPGSIAVMSASLGVGGALGLPASAIIAEYTDWHYLFWVAATLGLLAAVLVVTCVPESDVRTGGSFDFGGAFLLSIGLAALLLGISRGGGWGWASISTLAAFGIAAAAFVTFGWWELRVARPLVDLRISVRKQVLFTNLASIAFGFAMFAMTLVVPQVLQLPRDTGFGLGQSMLVAGLVMAPSGLVMMAVAPLSSGITRAVGPKVTLLCGAVVITAGYLIGVFMMNAVWQMILMTSIIGAGTGMAYGAMPALIMAAVPTSETGAAISLNTLMRSLGTSFASALAGVILAQMTVTAGGLTLPSDSAFRLVMAVAAGAGVLALVLTLFLPRYEAPGRDVREPMPASTRRGQVDAQPTVG
ncbi:MFS transporter [Rhodococcus sp. P1Y]|uniref:MFS transporter n=1 Tax=Rhodococcus sp. P1Y TaxID=1302308 RepID=UPI000EAE7F94|nr:MFS transporter [Rhodococcus sp. P1Y]AYJ52083.1 MFS transporter [Rhodococcus sp. P1Y]